MTPIKILSANANAEPFSFLGELHEKEILDRAHFQKLMGAITVLIADLGKEDDEMGMHSQL
jgi:hypothetical protein